MTVALVIALTSKPARADEPPTRPEMPTQAEPRPIPKTNDYCRKVTARAEGDAALLFAPTASVQVIRYPASGVVDSTGLQVGSGVQPRAALSLGLIDIYRGFGVLDAARADCKRQESAAILQEVVIWRLDIGRLPALERKSAYLHAQTAVVEELIRTSEERLNEHATTLLEVHTLRRRAFDIDLKRAEVDLEIELLKKRGTRIPSSIADVLAQYDARSVAHEESLAHLRKLQPWKLALTGGVTSTGQVDAFGVAELSYNFGGLVQRGAENRAVEARASELKTARYEMNHQIGITMRELRVSAERAMLQINVLEAQLARLAKDRASLDGLDAPNKAHVIAALTLEEIDLEAERTFLKTLAERQMAIGGGR